MYIAFNLTYCAVPSHLHVGRAVGFPLCPRMNMCRLALGVQLCLDIIAWHEVKEDNVHDLDLPSRVLCFALHVSHSIGAARLVTSQISDINIWKRRKGVNAVDVGVHTYQVCRPFVPTYNSTDCSFSLFVDPDWGRVFFLFSSRGSGRELSNHFFHCKNT